MSVTLPYPALASGAVVDQAQLNSNFSTLANKFGTIDNSDVKSGAGLDINKLSASYEYMTVKFRLDDLTVLYTVGNVTPVGGPYRFDVCPFYNDTKGDWTYVATTYATQNVGAGTGAFKVFWATFSGAAAGVVPALTIISTIDTITLAGSAIQSQASDSSPAVTTLASGTDRSLMVGVSTVDATATSPVWISCLLKRQIAT